jgi:hypothetical protein
MKEEKQMKFHSMTFFSSGEETHSVVISHHGDSYGWPFVVSIDDISYYFQSESQLIHLINSIIWAYNAYRKEQGYDR